MLTFLAPKKELKEGTTVNIENNENTHLAKILRVYEALEKTDYTYKVLKVLGEEESKSKTKKSATKKSASVKSYAPLTEEERQEYLELVHGGFTLRDLPVRVKQDKEIILEITKRYPDTYKRALPDEIKNDKEIALAAIRQNPLLYYYAPDAIKDDKEVALEAVKREGHALKYVSKRLKNDPDVAIQAINTGNYAYEDEYYPTWPSNYVGRELLKDPNFIMRVLDEVEDRSEIRFIFNSSSEEIKNNREMVLKAIKLGVDIKIGDKFKDDLEIILELMKQNLNNISMAGDKIRNNQTIHKIINKVNDQTIRYAPKELTQDREYVSQVLTDHYSRSQYAPEWLKNDREFMLEYYNGYFYDKLPDELKKDREITLIGLQHNGSDLSFVPYELRNDEEIVLEAIKNDYRNFDYASVELKSNKEFLKKAVTISDEILDYVPADYLSDKTFILNLASEYNSNAIFYASDKLKQDRDFVLAAVKIDGAILKFLPYEFQNDREIVLEAVKSSEKAIEFAGVYLQKDPEIAEAAIKKDGKAIDHLFTNPKYYDRDFNLRAVKNNGEAYRCINHIFLDDREIIWTALENSPKMIYLVKKDLIDDELANMVISKDNSVLGQLPQSNNKDFVLSLLNDYPEILAYAPKNLLDDYDFMMEAVNKNENNYQYASANLKENIDILNAVLDKNIDYFLNISDAVYLPKEIVLKVINTKPSLLGIDNVEEIRNDKEKLLNIVKDFPCIIAVVSESILSDIDYDIKLVKENHYVEKYLPSYIQNNKMIIVEKLCYRNLNILPEEYQDDKEIVIEMLKRKQDIFSKVSDRLKDDKEVVLEAVKLDHYNINSASIRLQKDLEVSVKANLRYSDVVSEIIEKLKQNKEIIEQDGKLQWVDDI